MIFENIPAELISKPQWVCYGKPGKPLKCPYHPETGYPAKAGDPATWTTFAAACAAVEQGRFSGFGFEFATGGGIVGVDFDHCIENGKVNEWAAAWIERFDSYAEISPSGTGVHIFCVGRLPGNAVKRPQAEMYEQGRYFTVTGLPCGPVRPLRGAQDAIDALYAELAFGAAGEPEKPTGKNADYSLVAMEGHNLITMDDDALLKIARKAKNGNLFNALFDHGNWQGLYASQSEADMALCNMLAFWTGRNAAQMDRLFRFGGLMRPKWDEKHGAQTYGQITIADAIRKCINVYEPRATAAQDFAGFEGFEGFEGLPHFLKNGSFEPFEPFEPPDKSKLPLFPAECLPENLRRYVVAAAEEIQVVVDMPAVIGLAVISLCVQGKFIVNPKPGWLEPVNLYTVTVAPPSDRKSPTLKVMTRYLYEFMREENERRAPAISEYRAKKKVLSGTVESLTKKAAGPKASSVDMQQLFDKQRELDELEPVVPLRLLADDVTPEALARLLSENDGRMAVFSAEGGLFDIAAGRYSQQANIDVLLKAYSGEPVMIDRIGRPSEYIPHPALTLSLSIQPSVLADIMNNNLFRGRGFSARLLYDIPKSTVGGRSFDSRPIPPEVAEEYRKLLFSLLSIPVTEQAQIIRLSEDAQEINRAFFYELEPRLVGDLEEIGDWAGKFHGQVNRIAALLHCCKHQEDAAQVLLQGDTMRDAVTIGRYFLEHALMAFQIMGLSDNQDTKDAKYILKRLDSCGETEISKRDLHQLCRDRTGFEKASAMDAGLGILIERGYIRKKRVPPQNSQNPQNLSKGGRPTEKIILNPEYLRFKSRG